MVAPSTNLENETLLDLGTQAGSCSNRAWEILDHRLRPQLIRWLQAERGFTASEAQDLAQDGLLRLYRHGHRFDGELSSVRNFLFTITDNLGKNLRRDRSRSPEMRVEVLAGREGSGAEWLERHTDQSRSYDPERDLKRRELGNLISEGLEELTPKHRAVLRLRLRGLEYREIASEVGIPCGTVKSRLWRARRDFHSALEERGVDLGEVVGT